MNVVNIKDYIKDKNRKEAGRQAVSPSGPPKNARIQRQPSPTADAGQALEFVQRLLPLLHDLDQRVAELDAKLLRLHQLLEKTTRRT